MTPTELVETTVGRIIFNDALPEGLRFKNYSMKKENLRQIVAECFKYYGRAATASWPTRSSGLASPMRRRAGASIAISDVPVPTEREQILRGADAKIDAARR